MILSLARRKERQVEGRWEGGAKTDRQGVGGERETKRRNCVSVGVETVTHTQAFDSLQWLYNWLCGGVEYMPKETDMGEPMVTLVFTSTESQRTILPVNIQQYSITNWRNKGSIMVTFQNVRILTFLRN